MSNSTGRRRMNTRATFLRTIGRWAGVLLVISAGAAVAAGQGAAPTSSGSPQAEAAQSPADALESLTWLLGEWTGMTDNAVVLVSAHWCDGGAFIEREIVVRPNGQREVGGTQRIGWDPLTKRVKCWTFDSLGGIGEGYWHREGDNWVVESSEVLADGQTSSTTAIFTPQGTDRFLWEVERASVNDTSLPKQKIEFVRAAEK